MSESLKVLFVCSLSALSIALTARTLWNMQKQGWGLPTLSKSGKKWATAGALLLGTPFVFALGVGLLIRMIELFSGATPVPDKTSGVMLMGACAGLTVAVIAIVIRGED